MMAFLLAHYIAGDRECIHIHVSLLVSLLLLIKLPGLNHGGPTPMTLCNPNHTPKDPLLNITALLIPHNVDKF